MLSRLLPFLLTISSLSLGFCAHGTELPSPSYVWFEARFFQHILRWTPIPNQSQSTYYEVALKKYGTPIWKDIHICREAQALSCDLTNFTLDLYHSYGYRARVRAVDNSRYSNWTITETRFTVDEVILTVDGMTLKVTNGIIYGTIHPPRPTIAPSGDKYEQIFKDHRVYRVSIRKLSEQKNTTQTVEQENFTLRVPGGMKEFCVKVMPYVESRNNKAEWSEEQCLHVTAEQCEWARLQSRQSVLKPPRKIQKAMLRVAGACTGSRASA